MEMKRSSWLSLVLTLVALPGRTQSPRLDSLWKDPAIETRIEQGIETNRKGDFTIDIPVYNGTTSLEIHQFRNEFWFGANAFMIGGFDSAGKNQRFETLFSSLFNLAVVPFFWKTLEPQQGNLRFDANSAPSYRRPPPDLVLAFCRKYGITPKGHCLVWNNPRHSMPDWLPNDTAEVENLLAKRITTVAARYGASIPVWDVVNESLHWFPEVIMPRDYVRKSFIVAKQAFPANDQLMINDVTSVWENNQQEYSPYYMLIRNLQLTGLNPGAIGLQFHFFSEDLFRKTLEGNAMTPKQLFGVLDLYARLGRPLQVSEITIPTLPNNDEGRRQQAFLTRNYYRLWFSHPAVEAIIWWNSVDGTAVKGEDKWYGGFVNNDLSPKPSYDVLNELINKEWKTNINTTLKGNNAYSFRGFYGDYLVRIRQGKKITEQKIRFSKDGTRTILTDK